MGVRGNLCATEDVMSTSRENPYNNDLETQIAFWGFESYYIDSMTTRAEKLKRFLAP